MLDRAAVDELADGADWVFHMAAAVGTFVIRDRTLDSMRTNLHGTENVVAASHRNQARLLLASTSEIYGKNDKIGLREDDDRVIGSPLKLAVELLRGEGDRREPGRRRTSRQRGLRAVDRPAVQHRRAAADRPVRHGPPALRAAGAAG